MSKVTLLALMCGTGSTGCVTTNVDISGSEFVQKVEHRQPGEKFVLRRNDRAGFFYADWFVMPQTQSIFELRRTFRTPTNELPDARFEELKKKVAEEEAKSPFPH